MPTDLTGTTASAFLTMNELRPSPSNVLNLAVLLGSVLALWGCREQSPSTYSGSGEPHTHQASIADLAADLAGKVVKVDALDKKGLSIGSGTGFFVTPDGKIATCEHIIRNAESIRITTLSGAEYRFKEILHADAKLDLALISVGVSQVAPFDRQKDDSAKPGESIFVLGNPLGLNGTLTEGVISAVRELSPEQRQMLQISALISPGSSGSPVVRSDGTLLGMVESRAQQGDGIGFALPANHIWEAVDGYSRIKDNDKAKAPSPMTPTKKYQPGKALSEDPEWNNGELPAASSHRLALLGRLQSRYPDEMMISIEIVRALREESEYARAFEECVRLIDQDPKNRIATHELTRIIARESTKIPYIKKAIAADPLNWRAREFVFEQERYDDQFLSSYLAAGKAGEVAPFSLSVAQGHLTSAISMQFHEATVENRFTGDFIPYRLLPLAIKVNNLRAGIAKAGRVILEPTTRNLEDFITSAETDPTLFFPYAWELNMISEVGFGELNQVIKGEAQHRLLNIVNLATKENPLITEAYFLDFSASNVDEGLFIDAGNLAWVRHFPGLGFSGPYDTLALIFMLNEQAGETVFSASNVLAWLQAAESDKRSILNLGEVIPHLNSVGSGKWQEPHFFNFWLSVQKEKFRDQLLQGSLKPEERQEIEALLGLLSGVPEKSEIVRTIEALDAEYSGSIWDYFGREYSAAIKSSFYKAAGGSK